ncbi:AGAP002023-PA [Anopheles gambiae str. PEST]|uniref:AGAP002023-PA n=1 Tax=Anopheles gambiae TaxID=7165 RepID=Q7PYN1_ANOGA|nr:AGAP002023-PA [Anopheles gambiae str. PEST]
MGANFLIMLGTIVVPLVVICFVSIVTFVNLYLNVRRRFPAKVNCWFCNHDTHVPYEQSNSFVCPACKQYNGFSADGDYNREIPEQYQQRLNNYHYHHPANVTDDDKWDSSTVRSVAGSGRPQPTSNGLCFGCNRNQELKIHQLASFVPENEDNYDAEVEEYRKQLEQAYKLCGRCERVLKRTLNDVKRNVLGSKLAQIGSKSLTALDMHIRASGKQLAHQKRQRWAKVCVWAITGLLAVKLQHHFADSGWTVAELMLHCPAAILSAFNMALSYGMAMRELFWNLADRVLAEPSVQQTTERFETIGYEIFLQYVPKSVVQTSAHYLESLSAQVPHERSSPALLNAAIVALAALLASLGSQRTIVKQLLIVVLCAADCAVVFAEAKNAPTIAFLLTSGALVVSFSCLGQRLVRSDVPASNLNSSFHKIYSQQCKESDYSDAETSTVGERDTSLAGPGKGHGSFGSISPPLLHRTIAGGGDMSGKSLDTTKSGSPSGMSFSTTNPFLMADGSPPLGCGSKFSGSLFNVAACTDHRSSSIGPADKESVFSGRTIVPSSNHHPTSAHSLLKTPSFSVDNFQTVSHGLTHRRNHSRFSGPANNQFHYSMNTINQQEEEDHPSQLIPDDIDRLSISGRVSLNSASVLSRSRVSLSGTTNPFAKKSLHEPEYDERVMLPSAGSLHHRARVFRAPEPFKGYAKDTLWTGGNSGGISSPFGGQLTHMSRTSSQSSGFESQAGTTRRNTPTEVDSAANVEMPSDELLSQHIASQARNEQPSPVPSSASVFEWNNITGGASIFGSKATSSSQHQRSLFSEQNLFNSALQQPTSAIDGRMGPAQGGTAAAAAGFTTMEGSGLFFPKLARTSTIGNGSIATGSTITPHMAARHIFPPQQSKTPSYHHQFSHNTTTTTTAAGLCTPFGNTASFASKALPSSSASLAGSSHYTSTKSTATGRASLLNISKFTHELSHNGTLPTA